MLYVQDAYTASDRFPHAQAFDPADLDTTGLGTRAVQLHPQQRQDHDGRLRRHDALLHRRPGRPDRPRLRRASSRRCSSRWTRCPRPAPHLRVPEELFNVQTRVFGRYHVTNAQQFFRTDDLWTVPPARRASRRLPSEAYYVIMRMPGEEEVEFLLLQPMVPISRPNMIAWVAARMDEPNYGQVQVYRFPADTTIFGPAQIEARIDQDPSISAQITLWNQLGQQRHPRQPHRRPGRRRPDLPPAGLPAVDRVRLPRVPADRRRLAASGRVGRDAGRGARSAARRRGRQPATPPTPTPRTDRPQSDARPERHAGPTPDHALPADVPGLIDYANHTSSWPRQALRDGDFARYGTEIAKVEAALQRLDAARTGPDALPSSSTSPAP